MSTADANKEVEDDSDMEEMGADIEAEGRYLGCIKAAMISLQRGAPPLVCIEYARRAIMPEERPTFEEMDKATKDIKKAA